MYRVELVLGIVIAIVWIFSVVSCVLTPESEVRHLPKWGWLILIVLLPLLGSVLWLGVGRIGGVRLPRATSAAPQQPEQRFPSQRRDYSSSITSDDRIRRMEEDLARLERESDDDRRRRPGSVD